MPVSENFMISISGGGQINVNLTYNIDNSISFTINETGATANIEAFYFNLPNTGNFAGTLQPFTVTNETAAGSSIHGTETDEGQDSVNQAGDPSSRVSDMYDWGIQAGLATDNVTSLSFTLSQPGGFSQQDFLAFMDATYDVKLTHTGSSTTEASGSPSCDLVVFNSTVEVSAINDQSGTTIGSNHNLITESQSQDGDGETVTMLQTSSAISFDSGHSSSDVFAGTPDTTIESGHEKIAIYNTSITANQDASHLVGTIDVTLSSGAYTWTNGDGAPALTLSNNYVIFNFTVTDEQTNPACQAGGTLEIDILGPSNTAPTLANHNPSLSVTDDENTTSVNANLLSQVGPSDTDGDTGFDVSSISANAHAGFTFSQAAGSGTIEINDASGLVGTLAMNLTSGAYTFTNGPDAEHLLSSTTFTFAFTIGDNGTTQPPTGTTNTGTLSITIPGDDDPPQYFLNGVAQDHWSITPSAIDDDTTGVAAIAGPSAVNSLLHGVSDVDGETNFTVGSITLNTAGFSEAAFTGTIDTPYTNAFNIIDTNNHNIGTLEYNINNGAWEFIMGPDAEKLLAPTTLDLSFVPQDAGANNEPSSTGHLMITINGDDDPPQYFLNGVAQDHWNITPSAIDDDTTGVAASAGASDVNSLLHGVSDVDGETNFTVGSITLNTAGFSEAAFTGTIDSAYTNAFNIIDTNNHNIGTLEYNINNGAWEFIMGPDAEKLLAPTTLDLSFVPQDADPVTPSEPGSTGHLMLTINGDDDPPQYFLNGVAQDHWNITPSAIDDDTTGVAASAGASDTNSLLHGVLDVDGETNFTVGSITLNTAGFSEAAFTGTIDSAYTNAFNITDSNNHNIGTLEYNINNGAWEFIMGPDAEKLLSPTTLDLSFVPQDADPVTPSEPGSTGHLMLTINGDDDPPQYFLNGVAQDHWNITPSAIDDDTTGVAASAGASDTNSLLHGVLDVDGETNFTVGSITLNTTGFSEAAFTGTIDSPYTNAFNIVDTSHHNIGTLEYNTNNGAWEFIMGADAEKLLSPTTLDLSFVPQDPGANNEPSSTGHLMITINGDDDPPQYFLNGVAQSTWSITPAAFDDDTTGIAASAGAGDVNSLLHGVSDVDGETNFTVGPITLNTVGFSEAAFTGTIDSPYTNAFNIVDTSHHNIGTLEYNTFNGAWEFKVGANIETLTAPSNLFDFSFTPQDPGANGEPSSIGHLLLTINGDDQCIIVFNATNGILTNSVGDDQGEKTLGSIIHDSGAHDLDNDHVFVSSVHFDAGTSSSGISANDLGAINGVGTDTINVFYHSALIGHLIADISSTSTSGNYTFFVNEPAAEHLLGDKTIEFDYALNDGSGSDDCVAMGKLDIHMPGAPFPEELNNIVLYLAPETANEPFGNDPFGFHGSKIIKVIFEDNQACLFDSDADILTWIKDHANTDLLINGLHYTDLEAFTYRDGHNTESNHALASDMRPNEGQLVMVPDNHAGQDDLTLITDRNYPDNHDGQDDFTDRDYPAHPSSDLQNHSVNTLADLTNTLFQNGAFLHNGYNLDYNHTHPTTL